MPQLFTHGRWVVKPGREEDFEAAWRDFAEWAYTPDLAAEIVAKD